MSEMASAAERFVWQPGDIVLTVQDGIEIPSAATLEDLFGPDSEGIFDAE